MAKKQPVQQVTPADTTEDAPHQRPGTPPKELPAWKAVFTTLCLPVCVLMVFTALAGLIVLTDPENKTWLGQSWFGTNWRKLMDYNSMFSAFFLNGGLLGGVIAYARLKEHRTAKELRLFQSQFQIYNPSELMDSKNQKGRGKSEGKKRK